MTVPLPPALDRLTAVADESKSSPIRKVMQMIEQQDDLLSLAAGEAKFDPPKALIDKACDAMQGGKNIYTSTSGIPGIRKAVADFVHDNFGADVDPETNIVLTVGGMEAIYLATRVLVSKGDKVLLPDPGWGVMVPIMDRKGAVIEYYPLKKTDSQWQIDADEITSRMDAATSLVVINSPSNPAGATLSKDGFMRVLAKAKEINAVVMSDEVYHNFVYTGEFASALSFNDLDNLIVINSFSKTFAVTGWRIGFAIAHPWLIRQMVMYKESTSLCSFSIGQWALADYLASSRDYLNQVRELCRQNMAMMVSRLNAIPGVHCLEAQGGFYLMPDFSERFDTAQETFECLLKGGVAVVPGNFFGSQVKDCVRMMFAANTDLISACMDRVEAALS